MQKKIKKVIGALKKASKLHAGQATTLKTALEKKKMRKGGMVKAAKKKMRGGGMVKAAKKKMMRGGVAKKKMRGDVSLSKSDKARLREYTKATGDNPSKTWSDGSYRNPMGDVRAWERESQAKMRPRNKPTPPKKKMRGGGMVKTAKKKMMRGGMAKKKR